MSGTKKNHRPFLKWAGNKYRIIERIRRRLPPGKRLIEPFAGSAAVFLNTDFQRYLVADSNADLIDLYVMLKETATNLSIRHAVSSDHDITIQRPITGDARNLTRAETPSAKQHCLSI